MTKKDRDLKLFRTLDQIPPQQDRLVVFQHLGLGDHFISYGIIVEISKRTRNLYVLCKPHNHTTCRSILAGLGNAVSVPSKRLLISSDEFKTAVEAAIELQADLFIIGHNPSIRLDSWDRDFYSISGVNFSNRYSSFSPNMIPEPADSTRSLVRTLPPRFRLVHLSTSEGLSRINLVANNDPVIEVDTSLSDDLLQWMYVALQAAEIHCVPSSFYCMIDSFNHLLSARLFLHENRVSFKLNPNNEHNGFKWNRVSYA
jgi:hypothetical protein